MDEKFWVGGPMGQEQLDFRQALDRLLQDSQIVWMLLEHFRECEKRKLPQWVALKLAEIHAIIDSCAPMIQDRPSWLTNS